MGDIHISTIDTFFNNMWVYVYIPVREFIFSELFLTEGVVCSCPLCVWETRKYSWHAQEDELSCAVFTTSVMDSICLPEAPDTPGLKLLLHFLRLPSCRSLDWGTELKRQEGVTAREICCIVNITDGNKMEIFVSISN